MASPALFDEFDPTELQDGVLTPVGNVHERLREVRERHPVMLGNAFTEVTSEAIGDQMVTVLGYDECHRVLTDPVTFSSYGLRPDLRPDHGPHSRRTRGSRPSHQPCLGVTVIPRQVARTVAP